ncbi:hypothetical protein ACFV4F_33410, partial [Kitasatospora sp. NPDC059722]
MTPAPIPGYRYDDPELPGSPVTGGDFEGLAAATLFSDADVTALKLAGEVLADQTEQILDVWYGFVGGGGPPPAAPNPTTPNTHRHPHPTAHPPPTPPR